MLLLLDLRFHELPPKSLPSILLENLSIVK